jgi:hypothetical protein
MTYTTLDAALTALDSVPATQEAILDFVHQLSVQADGAASVAWTSEAQSGDRTERRGASPIFRGGVGSASVARTRSLDKAEGRGPTVVLSGAERRRDEPAV